VGLDASTFVLEIVNFVILVWILKRFLYRPVLDVIAQRRAAIESSLRDAQAARAEAQSLKERYEGRVAEWAEERRRSLDALEKEIDAERARRRADLDAALENEKRKNAAAAARREVDARLRIEIAALEQSAKFASRLLERLASPELETRLIDAALEDLAALPQHELEALGNAARSPDGRAVLVTTAHPLAAQQRARIEKTLAPLIGGARALKFEQDAALVAGIRIRVGGWSLGLGLRDELEGFARLTHAD
jgi:F-type H+-transporting ATPase subunit b